MTEVKSISIKEPKTYDKLNEITPVGMSFSEQVHTAVKSYVKAQDIDEVGEAPTPDYLCADMQEWKTYLINNPDKLDALIRRNVQMRNILLQAENVIR